MLQDKFVIARSIASGIFAGTVHERGQGYVILGNARQIIEWSDEPTLSHIAHNGFMMPETVKMSPAVEFKLLEYVTEVSSCTDKAKKSIESIEPWGGIGESFNNYFGFGISELYTTEERQAMPMSMATENELEKMIH